jgi:Zn-dependent membrane protease YugP
MILIGLALRIIRLVWIGAAIFVLVVVFMFLTLPIEIDASRRGLRLLRESGLLNDVVDRQGTRQVLSAAALTYVSASALSIGQLLRYIRLARLG